MERIGDANFKKLVLESLGIVVVDLFAVYCGPCKTVNKIILELVEKYPDVTFYEVDVEKSPLTASNLEIRSIPTVIIYKNGKEKERIIGVREPNEIEENLKKIMKG